MNDFMRIFENKKAKTAVIDIDGYIGMDPWVSWNEYDEKQNTRQRIKQQLKELAEMKVEEITVNINSYGGDVNHGISIHDALAAHKAKIITDVQGHTASAATIIAQAGDERRMSDNALFLPHNASTLSWGDKNVSRQTTEDLEKMDDRISNIYAKKGTLSQDEYLEIMNRASGRGEWFTADEALENGFIDEIYEPTAMAASFQDLNPETLSKYGLPAFPDNIKDKLPEQSNNKQTEGKSKSTVKQENKMSDENKNEVKDNFIAMEKMFGAEKASEYFKNDLSMEDAMKDFIQVQNQSIKDLSDANDAHVATIADLEKENKSVKDELEGLKEGSDPVPKAGNLQALDDKLKDELEEGEGEDKETFMDKIKAIEKEENCSRTEATRKAASQFPELHDEYKNGVKEDGE